MHWTQIALHLPAATGDMVEPLFTALGAIATTREDAAAEPWYEESPGEASPWRQVRVSALFDSNVDLSGIRGALARVVEPAGLATWTQEEIEDRDWVGAMLEAWKPARFGRRLWICPTWSAPPAPEAVCLWLDPGSAFGTGAHATTALCLEWLEARELTGRTLLDYGCGSGILGLAALALGATRAWACDIDAQALAVTAHNAAANALGSRLWIGLPRDLPPLQVDVLVANILSGTLTTLAPVLAQYQPECGEILLGGILSEQADQVLEAYAPAYALSLAAEHDGWVLLRGHRRKASMHAAVGAAVKPRPRGG